MRKMKVRVHGYWTTNFDSIYLIKNLNFINYCNIRTKTLLSILVGKPNSYLNFHYIVFVNWFTQYICYTCFEFYKIYLLKKKKNSSSKH